MHICIHIHIYMYIPARACARAHTPTHHPILTASPKIDVQKGFLPNYASHEKHISLIKIREY